MAVKNPRIYILHIRDCCENILQYAAFREGSPYPANMVLDAACRNLEIIGEAARKVDAGFRASHPALPWRKMGDLRNVLIHAYDSVDPDVWEIVERDIPELLLAVRGVLNEDAS